MRRRLPMTACFMVIMGVAICMFGCGKEDTPPSKKQNVSVAKLSVGINTTMKSTPIILAKELGFFENNALQVTIVSHATGVGAIRSLFDGKVQITTGPEHIPAFHSIERSDFQILGVINRNQTHELIARKDHKIDMIQDLKGKKLGIKGRSSSKYWLNRLLLHNNLSLQDVELTEAEPKALVEMISKGSIDAVITWHPHAYRAKKALGDNAYSFQAQLGQDMYWVLVSMKKWITEHPGLVVRFLKAIQETNDFIRAYPEKVKGLVAKYLNLTENYVDFEWSLHQFRLELPQSLVIAMEQECRWKIAQLEAESNMPNYLEFISFDGISNINPDAISIIH